MTYAPTDWVDGVTLVDAARMDKIEAGIVAAVEKDSVVVAATRIVQSKLLAGDANPAFHITGDGALRWGPGGATALDTVLSRYAANQLKASGYLYTTNAIYANHGASTQVGLVAYQGDKAGVDLGGDNQLYRVSPANLETNGSLWLGNSLVVKGNLIYFGAALDAVLARDAAGVVRTDGAFKISGAGGLIFGTDTTLTRVAPAELQASGHLYAASMLMANKSFSAQQQVAIGFDGVSLYTPGMVFGGDTILRRFAASDLRTEGFFRAGGKIHANAPTGGTSPGHPNVLIGDVAGATGPGLVLGNDTSLYRAAATTLKSDGKLYLAKTEAGISNLLTLENGAGGVNQAGKGVEIRLGGGDTYYSAIKGVFEISSPSFLNPSLRFYTMNNTYAAGSELERLRIASDGKLWLDPYAALDVSLYRSGAASLATSATYFYCATVHAGSEVWTANFGRRALWAPRADTGQWVMMGNSSVTTIGANGLSAAIPMGATPGSILCLVAMNGDANTGSLNMSVLNVGPSTFQVTVWNDLTGAWAANGANVRVNWMALVAF